MPRLTIDGHDVEVAPGTNLIEAARAAGIEIPYFCYHPYLSVVGQCRICLVEVVGQPRLVIACATPASDGMVVKSESSARVKEAREAVMEFLLANHPLDCPVCDQAGECLLQDHSTSEQGARFASHMVETRRTFPGYERRLLGPHIIQNQNRCIHCSRCIRFTREISETGELTYTSRANHAFIDTFNGTPFDDPFSGCAADVCPVGALTIKEFRFRKRAWRLRSTASVCPGCSIGCSVFIDHHERIVYRFTPRRNPAINATWLCDHGRFLAETLNDQSHLHPRHRVEGKPVRLSWGDALRMFADELRSARTLRVVASANLSNEELFLTRELFGRHRRGEIVVPLYQGQQRRMKNGHGEWLHSTDAHPNSGGARRLGLDLVGEEALARFLYGAADLTVILDPDAHPFLSTAEALRLVKVGPSIACMRSEHPIVHAAKLMLPVPTLACNEGTFTSSTGMVQRFDMAFPAPGEARPLWIVLAALARELDIATLNLAGPAEVFDLMARTEKTFAGLAWEDLASARAPSPLERQHVG